MYKTLVLIVLLSSTFSLDSASDAEPDPPKPGPSPTKIVYQKRIPGVVVRRMPAKAKSCFYGTFQVAPGKVLAIHFYNENPVKELTNAHRPGGPPFHFTADLFEVSLDKRQKPTGHRYFRTFPLNYASRGWAPEKFDLQFAWLDPVTKTSPLLLFTCFALNDRYAATGEKVFVVFPGGWQSDPRVQPFAYEESASGGMPLMILVDLDSSLDAENQVRVKVLAGDESLALMEKEKTVYRWNGQAFVEDEESELRRRSREENIPPPSTTAE